MTSPLRSWINNRYQRWMAQRVPARDRIALNRRIIYILPTRNGMMFLLAAALIFIAAINYTVSLAYGLAFMMVSLFILAILYSFNNLNQLTLNSQPTAPVFCGEEAAFNVLLSRPPDRKYEALELGFPDSKVTHADLRQLDRQGIQVFLKTGRRGWLKAPMLRISTQFPLGLCRAWSVVDLNLHCLVYPRPIPFQINQFGSDGSGSNEAVLSRDGGDDYYGLRDYVPGDPLRQVAWKNVAKGQGMLVKQFADYVDEKMWLDWDMFYGFGVEDRLSRLCYGVLQLSRGNTPYGLKMPGLEIQPGLGAAHRNKMLKLLASYGQEKNRHD